VPHGGRELERQRRHSRASVSLVQDGTKLGHYRQPHVQRATHHQGRQNQQDRPELWKNGGPSEEYFLVEHRRQTGYDRKLPGGGLLVYHIDDSIDGNDNENHPQVKLLEADNQAQLHQALNRGDDGDPYPGRSANKTLDKASSPHSKAYAGLDTCVAITKIRKVSGNIKATVQVKCASGMARPRAARPANQGGRKAAKRKARRR